MRIQEPVVHDHTENELVLIGKESLRGHLIRSSSTAAAGAMARGLLMTAAVLWTAALLSNSFRDIGSVPGETVRAAFMAMGVIAAVTGFVEAFRWTEYRKDHDAENVVTRLTSAEPRPLKDHTT